MYHPIVKEQVIPGQLEGLQAIRNYSDGTRKCQAISTLTLRRTSTTLWKSFDL
jgi:hypothetical protein